MVYLLLPLAYLLGSLPFGVYIGRRCGVDVLHAGSGNIGATNVWRLCGWRAGLTAFLLDVLKGLAPTLVARALAPDAWWTHIGVALASVCGHTFSPWLHFRGGKGVATSFGAVLALVPVGALCGIGMFGVVTALTRYVSLGSLLGSATALVVALLLGSPWPYTAAVGVGVALIWIRHKANIGRLLRGQEPRLARRARRAPEGGEQEASPSS